MLISPLIDAIINRHDFLPVVQEGEFLMRHMSWKSYCWRTIRSRLVNVKSKTSITSVRRCAKWKNSTCMSRLHPIHNILISLYRFTSYDFKKMIRRSYYPQNQQIISTVTATSSTGAASRPVTPATEVGQVESTNGSAFGQKPGRQAGQSIDAPSIRMDDINITNEKAFAM